MLDKTCIFTGQFIPRTNYLWHRKHTSFRELAEALPRAVRAASGSMDGRIFCVCRRTLVRRSSGRPCNHGNGETSSKSCTAAGLVVSLFILDQVLPRLARGDKCRTTTDFDTDGLNSSCGVQIHCIPTCGWASPSRGVGSRD